MRLLLIRLRIFYTVDKGGGNRMRVDDRDRTEAGREGGWVGKGVGRKCPLSEIRRGAIRLGGHIYKFIIGKKCVRKRENERENLLRVR